MAALPSHPSQPPHFCRNLATSTRSKARPESELWAAHVPLSPPHDLQSDRGTTAPAPPKKILITASCQQEFIPELFDASRLLLLCPVTRVLSRRLCKAPRWPWEGHRASSSHSWLSPCPALQSIQQSQIQGLLTWLRHRWRGDMEGSPRVCSVQHFSLLTGRAQAGSHGASWQHQSGTQLKWGREGPSL